MSVLPKGGVTVEDVEDDDGFELDEEYEQADRVARSVAAKSSAGNGSNAAPSKPRSNSTASGEDRGGLSPGEESAFEVWLRKYVNQPLIDHVVPEWVSPNWISWFNTAVCWGAFVFGYVAYRYEHLYPSMSAWLRVLMGAMVFSSISLDCLDGMQARKTGRCSKLGEVLDHSLDAANVPLTACCVLLTVFPDDWTLMISLIGGSMIYNAQLVIYRHHHVFVLPPVTGPAAQAIAAASLVIAAPLYYFVDRHSYFVQLFAAVFAMVGNIIQFQNCHFYVRHLRYSFEQPVLWPHVRFALTMCLHGLLLVLSYIGPIEYLLSGVILAYRLNGKYVLDTLMMYKPFSATHTKDTVNKQDSHWRVECVAAIAMLLLLAATTGTGAPHDKSLPAHASTSVTGLPLVTDSWFHLAFYASMAAGVALNLNDLLRAIPQLEAKN